MVAADPGSQPWQREASTVDAFLLVGTVLGALIGLLHAGQLFRQRVSRDGAGTATAVWYAAWTFALWTLFGAYLLLFWIIGAAALAVAGLRRGGRAVR